MRHCAVSTIIAILVGVPSAHAQAPQPAIKGLVVHEWGVFRVNEDAEFANAALRAEWDNLPPFIHGFIKGRSVPQHWGAIEPRLRPIIFFHAEQAVRVRARIDFPGGMAGVWYPATEKPAVYGQEKQPKVGGSLEWSLGVKQCPEGWQPKSAAPLEVVDKHWFTRIRQVKADEIFANYSPNHADVERERFIYYDGLFPQGKWLKVTIDKERISITNRVKHPVFDLTMVDRRDDNVRVARIAKMDAGQTIKEVEFAAVESARFPSESAETLVKQLVAAGLFEDEARSLVDLWKRELFETPGVNLFYRLPQEEYQARMPLSIEPKPGNVTRVGLIYHAHLEPDFAERILELVQKLDAARFAERDAAMKKLLAIGPAALVQLQRIRENTKLSVDVRERVDGLLKRWNAKDAFDRE
jgi:hypothetical protein